MSLTKKLIVIIPILWLGFLLSISFMEAWLKFQAEGVTQTIGLSIGRLVFAALNKIEILFLIVLLVSSYKRYWHLKQKTLKRILISLFVILLLQTFHLLPILDQRANLIINGENLPTTYFHFYYVLLEVVKVILLCVFTHQTLTKYYG